MEDRDENKFEKIDSPILQDLGTELGDEALDSVAGGSVEAGYDTLYLTSPTTSDVAHNDPPSAT